MQVLDHHDTEVVFGTYRLNDPQVLELAVAQAIDAGVRLIDTAVMYRNDELVAKLIKGTPAKAGTKLNRASTIEADLARSIEIFGSDLERVLLHRPMPYAAYAILEKARERGDVKQIGVCNVSEGQLLALLEKASEHGAAPPDVVQNELHPALNTPVAALCAHHGIKFEAHSVLLAGEVLVPIASQAVRPISVATLAILHARARGAHALALTTTKLEHLVEDLEAARTPDPAAVVHALLPAAALEELAALPDTHPICKYGRQSAGRGGHAELPHPLRLAVAQATLEKDIAAFRAGGTPSDLCLMLPKISRANASAKAEHALAEQLAKQLFGEGESGRTKFDMLLRKMRTRVHEEAAKKAKLQAPLACKLGPKDAVEKAEELPVAIPAPESFDALLQTLREAQGPTSRLTKAGALTADGRLDLCKQVVRPCFVQLVDSIEAAAPGVVRDFLVGNNIIFKRLPPSSDAEPPAAESESDVAAKAGAVVDAHLQAFERLASSAQPIRTFYLAGNGITAESSAPIAAALGRAKSLETLWLKMNMISTGAYHFGRLCVGAPKLVLLDLFNTGLLDAGCAALAAGLAEGDGPAPQLEHLYLNVNGLTQASLPSLVSIVNALPKLQSLYLGENRLGDEAAIALLETVPLRPLVRLELGSNGLTDASLPAIVAFVYRHAATLRALDLSTYKSTHFFRLKPNAFGDTSEGRACLVRLASDFTIAYLGLDNCLPSRAAAAALLPRLTATANRVSVNARQRRAPTDEAEAPPPRLQLQRVGRPLASAAAFATAILAAIGAACTAKGPAAAADLAAPFTIAAAVAAVLLTAKSTDKAAPPVEPLAAVTNDARKIGNSLLQHTAEELTAIRHPPQLPHVMSIYRNKM